MQQQHAVFSDVYCVSRDAELRRPSYLQWSVMLSASPLEVGRRGGQCDVN